MTTSKLSSNGSLPKDHQDLDMEIMKFIADYNFSRSGLPFPRKDLTAYKTKLNINHLKVTEEVIKQRIKSLIEAEVEKAKQSSYLDGLEAGIEMTMKRYNIPQTIIKVREN